MPRIELSTPAELRLPLRWIAILRAELGAGGSLAASSGVALGRRRGQGPAVGADVVMMTSAMLRHGPGTSPPSRPSSAAGSTSASTDSVAELRGSAVTGTALDRPGIERANYLATLRSWTTPAWLTPGGVS